MSALLQVKGKRTLPLLVQYVISAHKTFYPPSLYAEAGISSKNKRVSSKHAQRAQNTACQIELLNYPTNTTIMWGKSYPNSPRIAWQSSSRNRTVVTMFK
jgi:hypothetical protein